MDPNGWVEIRDVSDARDMLERAAHAATAGNFGSADELLRNATRIQEDTLGPLHPDLANTFNNLAIVAEKTGNLDDAETFYCPSIAARCTQTDTRRSSGTARRLASGSQER